MIISTKQIQQALQVYGSQGSKNQQGKIEQGEKIRKVDEVSLSEQVQAVQIAATALAKLPEVREEKVAQLKQAVRSGNYNVKGEDIAEKMLGRALIDQLR